MKLLLGVLLRLQIRQPGSLLLLLGKLLLLLCYQNIFLGGELLQTIGQLQGKHQDDFRQVLEHGHFPERRGVGQQLQQLGIVPRCAVQPQGLLALMILQQSGQTPELFQGVFYLLRGHFVAVRLEDSQMLGHLAQRFAGDIENARQNRAGIDRRNGPGTRFSIQDVQGKNGDYPDCVVLDTDLFKGIKPRDWGRILQNHIYKNFAGQTLTLYDENWYSESVQIARYNDRVTKDGGVRNHRAIDDLAWTRGNNIQALATAHIGEILEVSTYEENNDINRHGWMDKNGWTFRHAYLCDNKGNIYEATLNIAEGKNRRILYRITNIKEIDKRTVGAKGLSAATGRNQATTNGSSKVKIPLVLCNNIHGG